MKTYLQALWLDPKACRKAWAALIGVALLMGSEGLLPNAPVVQYVLALFTVISTYAVRNDPPKGGTQRG